MGRKVRRSLSSGGTQVFQLWQDMNGDEGVVKSWSIAEGRSRVLVQSQRRHFLRAFPVLMIP